MQGMFRMFCVDSQENGDIPCFLLFRKVAILMIFGKSFFFYIVFGLIWAAIGIFLFPYLIVRVIWNLIVKNLIWTFVSMFMTNRELSGE